MFCNSDTTIAALTSWPGVTCPEILMPGEQCGLPLSNPSMVASRDNINAMASNSQRVVQHVQILPQDSHGMDIQLAIMEQIYCTHRAWAWKLYPGFGAGFRMDDAATGRRVIERGLELGLAQFCVHKGLQIGGFFRTETNYPDDIGPVARDYPEAKFVIYHSAICTGNYDCSTAPNEGPYDPFDTSYQFGTNALIRSLQDNGIGPGAMQTPNTNVYGEVGSAINEVMGNTTAAQHFFGKLMLYLGTDYVVWGTDSVIYGSPQQFIEWFRTLTIPQSMQDQYGYPPLDAMNKAKIFGLNAARLYGLDSAAIRCGMQQCPVAQIKRQLDEELGPRRWMFRRPGGPRNYAEFAQHAKSCVALGRPG